ncbi:psbF, partial [Symbiodinium sp. KB8]
ALLFVATCGFAAAFVPPAQTGAKTARPEAVVLVAPEPAQEASSGSFSSLAFGASVGYAAAAVGAAARQGRTALRAEDAPAVARTPVAYPIFTFRWLAIHALV